MYVNDFTFKSCIFKVLHLKKNDLWKKDKSNSTTCKIKCKMWYVIPTLSSQLFKINKSSFKNIALQNQKKVMKCAKMILTSI